MGDLNRYAGSGNFLRKEDCPRPIVATISRTGEHVFDGKAPQLVLYFQQQGIKPLACNSTNTRLLIALLGVQTEEQLAGRTIEIYHDPSVMMRGQVVGGLRIRLPQQQQQPAAYHQQQPMAPPAGYPQPGYPPQAPPAGYQQPAAAPPAYPQHPPQPSAPAPPADDVPWG